jgi:hypothetical protein
MKDKNIPKEKSQFMYAQLLKAQKIAKVTFYVKTTGTRHIIGYIMKNNSKVD